MVCEGCGGKMHETAVVCPHCGARRAQAPKLALDRDEVRALLVMSNAAEDEEERDWLATLVLPHPSTHGAARALELALTVISLPFVVVGVLMFALHRMRKRKNRIKMRGEVGPLALMSLMGGLGMMTALGLAGIGTLRGFQIVVGFITVLAARAAVRTHSKTARSRELARIDKPVPPSLPAARARDAKQPAPPSAPSTPVVAPAAAPAQDAPKDGEEPRLLR
jgi:hypothetical protein